MSDDENCLPPNKRTPWNKGKLIGARPPLRPKHVWSIRTRLLLEGRICYLAPFNLAIDSKLRGVTSWPLGSRTLPQTVIRWTARRCGKRRQDGRSSLNCGSDPPSHRRLHEGCGQETGEFLFAGRRCSSHCMTTRQYARLLSEWTARSVFTSKLFRTHSLWRTKATLIYRRAQCPQAPISRHGLLLTQRQECPKSEQAAGRYPHPSRRKCCRPSIHAESEHESQCASKRSARMTDSQVSGAR